MQVNLDDVLKTSDGKRVSVLVKVLKMEEKEEIKPGLFKRDATIADAKGHLRLTLWKSDTDKLEEGKTYRLHNVLVKSFNAIKYLTTPKAGLYSTPEEDLDNVVSEPDTSSTTDHDMLSLTDAEVVGVDDITKRMVCIKCRSTVDRIDAIIGICSRCSLSQRTDRCPRELVVRLLIIGAEEEETRTFTAFQKSIVQITGDDTINGYTSEEKVTTALLKSMNFNCTYSGSIIKTVDRPNN